jgi:hypothetical protein
MERERGWTAVHVLVKKRRSGGGGGGGGSLALMV